jgi:hypothetical protein
MPTGPLSLLAMLSVPEDAVLRLVTVPVTSQKLACVIWRQLQHSLSSQAFLTCSKGLVDFPLLGGIGVVVDFTKLASHGGVMLKDSPLTLFDVALASELLKQKLAAGTPLSPSAIAEIAIDAAFPEDAQLLFCFSDTGAPSVPHEEVQTFSSGLLAAAAQLQPAGNLCPLSRALVVSAGLQAFANSALVAPGTVSLVKTLLDRDDQPLRTAQALAAAVKTGISAVAAAGCAIPRLIFSGTVPPLVAAGCACARAPDA